MYKKINWKNHIVEYPLRRTIEDNSDGTYTVSPSPGEILQRGTKQSAENFNHMDDGIFDISMFTQFIISCEYLGVGYGKDDMFEMDDDDIAEVLNV